MGDRGGAQCASASVAKCKGGGLAGALGVDPQDFSSLALKYAVGLVVVLLVLSLLARGADSETGRYAPGFVRRVRSLVRTAAKSSVEAEQDSNPVVRLIHTNTALSYASAARHMLPARETDRVVGVDLDEMIHSLEASQLQAMRRINEEAPALQPEGVFAVHTGWLA